MQRKSVGTLVMLVTIAVLQYWIWIDPRGLAHLIKMRDKLTARQQRAQLLQKQNRRIKEEIEYLKEDGEAAELRARTSLGMIKEGERYYQVNAREEEFPGEKINEQLQ